MRCSNLISLTSGQDLTPDKYNDKKNGIPYITGASNFSCGHVIINRWTQFPKAFAEQGNILLTCKGTIGELALLKEAQVHIARQVMAIQPIISSLCDFLLLILEVNVQRFKTEAQSMIPGISRDVVLESLIPLPPTLEQYRMVSKLKSLLPDIEKYGIKTTTLNKINSEFPVLLKKSILQHAIQGKLVPQDPNDEPASVLLERIAKERAKLGKKAAKSMSRIERRDRGTYEIFPDGSEKDISGEVPFEIPNSWEWCRLCNILFSFSTGPFGSMVHKSDYIDTPNGIPLINPTNIKNGSIRAEGIQKVSIEKAAILENYKVRKDDIILARRGDLSKCAIVTETENLWLCGTGAFFIRLLFLDNEYFCLLYSSFHTQSVLHSESVGTTMINLNQKLLNNLLIPVPPIQEQHRIVEKLGVLMNELGTTK